MDDRLCLVQFLHPGGEPSVHGGELAWNTGPLHKRKFLGVEGSYLTTLDGEPERAPLGFWGEWEPQSRVTPLERAAPEEPAWLHEPYFDPPERGVWAQNTDPFVFGGEFHYTGCQQHSHTGGRTQLSHLRPGSVVLFGSGRARRFVLDTVFVTGPRWVDHSRRTLDRLDGVISSAYREITIDRWYAPRSLADDRVHRLYFGATFDDPLDGMFSFFPCRPLDGRRGFARAEIRLPGSITQTQTQRFKLTRLASTREAAGLWCQVAEQVLEAGLALGVSADLPPRSTSTKWRNDTEAAGCAAA